MKTSTLGPLRVRRVVKDGPSHREGDPPGSDRPLTCVLLHGFGAPGDDLVPLADELDVPAGTELLFPEALHALEDFLFQPSGGARAWWRIDVGAIERAILRGEVRDLTRQVPEGLAEARAAVSAMLDALEAERGDGTGPLVLGGFSQGAMLSLDVALREPSRRLDGLILLSGTLLAEHEWGPLMPGRRGLPVFQSHGDGDPVLPFSIAERLRDALRAAGLDVTFDAFHGPHTIPPATLERLGAWLRERAVEGARANE
jgi:phospholipase/carboxylesterase